jgi:cytochrome c oxidase subunit 2
MKRKLFLLWWGLGLVALLVAACGPLARDRRRYASNGERIYFSGASANGRIGYSGGDSGGMMDAPDIRWSELTEAAHGGHDDGEPEMEHLPYDEETFKQAVTRGLDPGGDALDSDMPRWRMSEADLEDLIAYLKTLN